MQIPLQSPASTGVDSIIISKIKKFPSAFLFGVRFDTTYSQRLSGIISPEEFQASIHRINTACRIQHSWWANLIAVVLCIGGLLCLILGLKLDGVPGFVPYIGAILYCVGVFGWVVLRSFKSKAASHRLSASIASQNQLYAARGCTFKYHRADQTEWIYVDTPDLEIELNVPVVSVAQLSIPITDDVPPLTHDVAPEPLNAPLLFSSPSSNAISSDSYYQPPVN